jgi:histidinol dehydrogenase
MQLFQFPRDRARIERFCAAVSSHDRATEDAVRRIIEDVRQRGDEAVIELAKEFDQVEFRGPEDFFIPRSVLRESWEGLPDKLKAALELARKRIEAYHERQKLTGFSMKDEYGNILEQRVVPLQRVGVYVPGGTAAYPSTVLMDIVPARVAGVEEIIMITPPPRRGAPDLGASLGAAWLAGVDRVVGVGGPLGVAALAIGTASLPKVDLIVGPGNKYVAMAKKMLYGEIVIDMIAGPSELLVIADRSASIEHLAADMLSQAEHDPDAQSVAVLIGDLDIEALQREIERQASVLTRGPVALRALRDNGAIIRVEGRADAVEIANLKAPEHLMILTENPRELADQVRNVGAVFVGPYTPEPMGDYVAGPNHTLPTGGTARFFSPLSVWSFLKTSHVVEFTREGFEALAGPVITIAEAEGLTAHAEAVRRRLPRI